MHPMLKFENFLEAPALNAQACSALLEPNPRLDQALANSKANGLPPISVLPMSGQYLTVLARLMGATSVLEVGTLGGYSAICFAQAGIKVTSIEINQKHRDVALENVHGLDVEVLLGSALDVMSKLAGEGKQYDMVFIDADMDGQMQQFDWAVKLTRPNGCIFLDDVVPPMFRDGNVGSGKASILSEIGKDDRVTAALMPTIASHPMFPTPVFNGFIMAIVNDRQV